MSTQMLLGIWPIDSDRPNEQRECAKQISKSQIRIFSFNRFGINFNSKHPYHHLTRDTWRRPPHKTPTFLFRQILTGSKDGSARIWLRDPSESQQIETQKKHWKHTKHNQRWCVTTIDVKMLAPIEGPFQGKRNSRASMFQNIPSFIKARTGESQPLGSWTKILSRLHFWTSMSYRSVMEAWTLEATLHGRLAFSFPTGLHESHTTSVDVLNTFNENKSKTHLAIQYTRCSQK